MSASAPFSPPVYEAGTNLPASATNQVQPKWQLPGAAAAAAPYLQQGEFVPKYSSRGAGLRRTHRPLSAKHHERAATLTSGTFEGQIVAPSHTQPEWRSPLPYTPIPTGTPAITGVQTTSQTVAMPPLMSEVPVTTPLPPAVVGAQVVPTMTYGAAPVAGFGGYGAPSFGAPAGFGGYGAAF